MPNESVFIRFIRFQLLNVTNNYASGFLIIGKKKKNNDRESKIMFIDRSLNLYRLVKLYNKQQFIQIWKQLPWNWVVKAPTLYLMIAMTWMLLLSLPTKVCFSIKDRFVQLVAGCLCKRKYTMNLSSCLWKGPLKEPLGILLMPARNKDRK